MYHLDIKALSQNQRRHKSDLYKQYEMDMAIYLHSFCLPEINPDQQFHLFIEFGIPKHMDVSNAIKVFEDQLCKHLDINDRNVMSIFVRKIIKKKTEGFIRFNIFFNEMDLVQTIKEPYL